MMAHGVGPAWMSMTTSLVALAATLPFVIYRPAAMRTLTLRDLTTGAYLAAGFSVYNVSLVLTTVVTAVLLFYLSPLWSALLGWLLHGERLNPLRLAALAFGFAGLILTLGFEHGLPVPHRLGDWLALAAGVMWAYGSVRSYTAHEPSFAGSLLSFNIGGAASALACIAILPAAAGTAAPTLAAWQTTLPGLVALGLLFVLPSTLVLVWATQRLPAPRVGILMMTEIVAGTITAALFAGEPFGPVQVAGSLLILLAGVLEVASRVPSKLQTDAS
jgi:drug/metabolite transporter (DMT)-like permease